jgi:Tat protein secretion system quality control protein TatD with DNase activity
VDLDLDVLIGAKGVVAVEECGLNQQSYTTETDLDRERNILEHQLQLAKLKDLPVVIHCRGDEKIDDMCLSVLQKTLTKIHHITNIVLMEILQVTTNGKWPSQTVYLVYLHSYSWKRSENDSL